MGRPPGMTVFVGNISYETTEEQLKEVFSQVGNVLSFRLMYDHETGKAKGFGFCEYEDKETAMSAMRNLNGTELNGRALRVDLTANDKQAAKAQATAAAAAAAAANAGAVPGHPALPKQLSGPNPSMARMTPREIHETMVALKRAIEQDVNSVREMLLAKPALAHAVLHGQIMLGMVPPPPMPPPQGAAPPPLGPPAPPHMPGPPVQAPPMMQSGPPVGPPHQQPPQPMQGPPPPMGAVPLPPGQQVPALNLNEEQATLFKTVMSLTQEQIDQLPPKERDGVMVVRNRFAMQQQQLQQPVAPPQMQGQPPQQHSYR